MIKPRFPFSDHAPMFVLAHLSDPHLPPLPKPRRRELLSKRGLGYINWLWRRRLIHRADVLAALVADLEGHKPDHVAVTGDLINLSLTNEFAPALAWLGSLGRSARRHDRSRQPRLLCAAVPVSRNATGPTSCAATSAKAFPSCGGAGRWR